MSINITIARPYAKAVFNAALENESLAQWAAFLQRAAAFVRDAQVVLLLKNPRLTTEQRFNFVAGCVAIDFDEGRNFLKTLAVKNRLLVLPEIAVLFETYRIEQEKKANIQVTSAFPLSTLEQQQLTQVLKNRLQREILLVCDIDKSLIGGMVIRSGNLVIDGSVRGKLTRLAAQL